MVQKLLSDKDSFLSHFTLSSLDIVFNANNQGFTIIKVLKNQYKNISTNLIKDLYISYLLENKQDMVEMYKTVKIILSDEKT